MEKDIPCKWKSKESQSGNSYSDKMHFKVENIIRNKGHDKMINGPVQEKGIAVVNIYSFNIGIPQYIKQRVTNIR